MKGINIAIETDSAIELSIEKKNTSLMSLFLLSSRLRFIFFNIFIADMLLFLFFVFTILFLITLIFIYIIRRIIVLIIIKKLRIFLDF